MQIFIKFHRDNNEHLQIFTLEVENADTIESVKEKITLIITTPVKDQILYFHGVELEDGRTLKDYNIQKEGDLDLFIKAVTSTTSLIVPIAISAVSFSLLCSIIVWWWIRKRHRFHPQLLVNPTSYESALKLIKLGVDQISVGMAKFSQRNNCCLMFGEITALVNLRQKTKIVVLVNKLFFENELPELTDHLITLNEIGITDIMFSDYAVAQIAYELHLPFKLIYHPETLVVNYGQFPFYLKNDIKQVALARELNWTNLQTISEHKCGMELQVQVAGYAYMMQSRWNLLSNYQQYYQIKEQLKYQKLMLKEETREHEFLIYEDDHGTHIMTGYNLCLIDHLKKLINLKIDVLRIDSFLHDEAWLEATVKYYLAALKKPNDKQLIEAAKTAFKKYDKIQSHGFAQFDPNHLIYLLKQTKMEWNND